MLDKFSQINIGDVAFLLLGMQALQLALTGKTCISGGPGMTRSGTLLRSSRYRLFEVKSAWARYFFAVASALLLGWTVFDLKSKWW